MAVVDRSNKSLTCLEDALLSLGTDTTELTLAFNSIESLGGGGDFAATCPSLCRLNLAHNRLTRPPELGALRFLMRLDLSHNRLNSLEGLSGCYSLEELWIPHNKLDLSALSQLGAAPGLPSLRALIACNNPADKVQPHGLAAALLLQMLPLLQTLDARGCVGEERKRKLSVLAAQGARHALVAELGQKRAVGILKQEGPAPVSRQLAPSVANQSTVPRGGQRGETCGRGGRRGVNTRTAEMLAGDDYNAENVRIPGQAVSEEALAVCESQSRPSHLHERGAKDAGREWLDVAMERAQRRLLESESRLREAMAAPAPVRVPPHEPTPHAFAAASKAAMRVRSSRVCSTALSADTDVVVQCGPSHAAGSINVLIRADGSSCARWSGGRVAVSVDRDEAGPLGYMLSAYYRDGSTCAAFDSRGGGLVMRPKGAVLLRHDPAKGGSLFDAEGRMVEKWPAPAAAACGDEELLFGGPTLPQEIHAVLDDGGHFGFRFCRETGGVSIVLLAGGALHELKLGANKQEHCNLDGDQLARAMLDRAAEAKLTATVRRPPNNTPVSMLSIADSVAGLSSNNTLKMGRTQVRSISTGL
jgi:hypothetical protein